MRIAAQVGTGSMNALAVGTVLQVAPVVEPAMRLESRLGSARIGGIVRLFAPAYVVSVRDELVVSRGYAVLTPMPDADGTLPSLVPDSAFDVVPSAPWVGTMGPGRFKLSVGVSDLEPQTVAVELHPKLGATPADSG